MVNSLLYVKPKFDFFLTSLISQSSWRMLPRTRLSRFTIQNCGDSAKNMVLRAQRFVMLLVDGGYSAKLAAK
jgi:hypothetical protein